MITQLILILALALDLQVTPARIMRVDHGRLFLAFDQADYVGVCRPGRAAAIDFGGVLIVLGGDCAAIAR